ncbi:hypothetical protein PWG71_18135 [Nocardiopsis sp. N85]|uniref:hypothetical protein n=1 Tax=Nocardiopsis sp. N85 TaxID=3029400 RepID=UPI00237F0D78|nr:hypothetical protein [Nocardiopsis sp. N85]MDE3723316.1 hypothetical protein [Nocardiopsis sp. N85]
MYSSALFRTSAVLGVLSGAFMAGPAAVEAVTGETALTGFFLGLSPSLAVPLLVALYLGQSRAAGVFGAVAYVVNLLGLGLFGAVAFSLNIMLYHLDGAVLAELMGGVAGPIVLGSAVVFALGSVLFGVSMVRARVHPRVPAWAYTVFPAALALAAPLPDSPLTLGIHVVAGASLVWLAVSLWSKTPLPGTTDPGALSVAESAAPDSSAVPGTAG